MAGADELEAELEVAAILCDLRRILRARDRRQRRRQQLRELEPLVPSWGRHRRRSVLEVGKPSATARTVERGGGAASPDTPLAFPAAEEEEEEEEEADAAAKKATAQAEEQRVVVASLSREKADLLKQIEEYRARLLSSMSANEGLKHLHKVRQQQQEEQARKMMLLALRHGTAATTTTTTAPANPLQRRPPLEKEEWNWQQQVHKARSVTAEARRRRLEIMRAKPYKGASCRRRGKF